jgi:TonB family protein
VTPSGPSLSSSRALWLGAAAGALALHLCGVALAVVHLQRDGEDDELGAPGIEIGLDLAAPQAPPTDLPAGPDSDAAAASSASAAATAQAEKVPEDLPREQPVESENPDRVVTTEVQEKPKKEEQPTPTAQATPSAESAASEATAMPTSETAKVAERATTVAQGTGEARQRVRTTWQRELVAHLDRHKRYPADREQKTAEIVVSFSIDRRGRLLSSAIAKSSGDPAFDAAALAMLKRSDPVPPPPPLIADETLSFTVPVIFRVKGRG